ncbi:hypothetical protein MLD38_004777 [Melastoma candidum]|uniref:Uncharacterized protein n=1 Tax=Melastoma candidum TaxID=119954 RepID=A0ACB9SAR3_9MYRT|nr:hypothetical protein MLD38_004777 [Melastoma candidum]
MKQAELTVILSVAWVVTLLYGEMVAFWVPSMWSCPWPHASKSMSEGDPNEYVKVAVIADPQIMDRTTLRLQPNSLALELAQFYTDLYMRRAYLGSIRPVKPDAVIFLGDYFDGGPDLSDEEWQLSLSRFKHIFDLRSHRRHADFSVHFIPGNHDIGYASLHHYKPEVIVRYESEFGFSNSQFTIGKVEFIAVDAQSLDGKLKQNWTSLCWDFIKSLSTDAQLNPRVLLTHIPLYRQDETDCGPSRYSPIINQRIHRSRGEQEITYQNYVTEESSKRLLNSVKPVLVLSGHDHDQCTVVHEFENGSLNEITVGSVSWQQGNLYPSFMLLSVSNTTSTTKEPILTQLCFLPVQLHIYIWYIGLFVITVLASFFWPTSSESLWVSCGENVSHFGQILRSALQATKEKNDDDYEYEEIWDSEGIMHLIKKKSPSHSSQSGDQAVLERGSASVRPAARRHNQEVESSSNVEISVDGTGNKPLKSSKSRLRMVVQRLVRATRMIIIVASVNVPLYMMLLFKDWNDQ